MPLIPRSLLRRLLVIAGLGFLTLLTLLAGVYWLIFHRPDWIRAVSYGNGAWVQRTLYRIYYERLRWPSADTNDNGVPDWYEVLLGHDPRTDSTLVRDCLFTERPRFVFLGERTRIRLELAVPPDEYARWPSNMELLVTAAEPVLLAAESAQDTPPTTGPLRVQVTPQGLLEFDVLYLRKPATHDLHLAHARSGYVYSADHLIPFEVPGWRLPAVRSHVEQEPMDQAPGSTPQQYSRLVWEPLPDRSTVYILQAARADAPDEWESVHAADPDDPTSRLIDIPYDRLVFPDYEGPLLYRVIPVIQEKPEAR